MGSKICIKKLLAIFLSVVIVAGSLGINIPVSYADGEESNINQDILISEENVEDILPVSDEIELTTPQVLNLELQGGFVSGKGTEQEPYEITTKEDLIFLSEKVNSGDSNYNDKCYKLMNDISLKDIAWIPIGTELNPFSGSFDGNDKTIRNMYVRLMKSDTKEELSGYAGFFGNIQALDKSEGNLSIKNLCMQDAVCNIANSKDIYVGGLAGCISGGNKYEISNIKVRVELNGEIKDEIKADAVLVYLGGLAGIISKSTVKDSESNAEISVYNQSDNIDVKVGGFIGFNDNNYISDCIVKCDIKERDGNIYNETYSSIGLFVGENTGEIKKSSADGRLKLACKSNGSGFVGVNTKEAKIIDCLANVQLLNIQSQISKTQSSGFVNINSGEIINCIARGTIENKLLKKIQSTQDQNYSTYSQVYSSGRLKLARTHLSGFVFENNGKILNSLSQLDIQGEWKTLISGFAETNTGEIMNCGATGNIKGDEGGLPSGFVYENEGLVMNSYSAKSISSGNPNYKTVSFANINDSLGILDYIFYDKDNIGQAIGENSGKQALNVYSMSEKQMRAKTGEHVYPDKPVTPGETRALVDILNEKRSIENKEDGKNSKNDWQVWTVNEENKGFPVFGDSKPVPSTYTVTFENTGESIVDKQTVNTGEKAVRPSDPVKAGYIFTGWYKAVDFIQAWDFNTDKVIADTTLYANWEKEATIIYTVTFENTGESIVDKQTVNTGETAVRPSNPVKAGYIFTGWYKAVDFIQAWDFNTDKVIADTTLYAKWEKEIPATYTVKFESDGGFIGDTQTVNAGEKAVRPSDPVKAGYIFTGWYKAVDFIQAWDFNTDKVIADTTLYANWEKEATITYTVKFESGGGSIVDKQTVNAGETAVRPTAPVKSGHIFKGWYKATDFIQVWNFDTEKVIADTTLYANWEKEATITYTVKFESGGGSIIDKQTVNAGETAVRPTAPVKAGHIFKGWYKATDFIQVWNFDTEKVIADTTLYANWEKEATITYTVKFESGGGSIIDKQTVNAGETAVRPTAPVKAGHIFKGWYKATDFIQAWDFNTEKVIADTTLYANWEKEATITYTVKFESGGGSIVDKQTVNAGETAVRPTAPVKSGHIFKGWYKATDFIQAWNFNTEKVTKDTTLYANWEKEVPVTPGGGGSSGGGGSIPKPSDKNITIKVNGKLENLANETKKEENGKKIVEVDIKSEVVKANISKDFNFEKNKENLVEVKITDVDSDISRVLLKGDLLKVLEGNNTTLSITRDNVKYSIPTKELDVESTAKKLNIDASNLKGVQFELEISKVSKNIKNSVIASPVEFRITGKAKNADGSERIVNINSFSKFVGRTIELPTGTDLKKVMTGIVFNEDGTYSPVPTKLFEQNGKYYVELNSFTNSIYTVIYNPMEVESVKGHWSESAVNDMASRLVLLDTKNFEPNKAISREEFANYIVRALGLYRGETTNQKQSKFSDVSSESPSLTGITTANEWGIISGYPDGSFRPKNTITREEAMSMYSRAMEIAELDKSDDSRILNYKDSDKISSWAYKAVQKTVGSGVFNGRTADSIEPKGTFTCAEAAVAIRNLLAESGLINK